MVDLSQLGGLLDDGAAGAWPDVQAPGGGGPLPQMPAGGEAELWIDTLGVWVPPYVTPLLLQQRRYNCAGAGCDCALSNPSQGRVLARAPSSPPT